MATTRRLSRQRSGKNDRRTSASAFAQLIAVSAIARIKQITPNADLAFLPFGGPTPSVATDATICCAGYPK
jgi:hypothetical protein